MDNASTKEDKTQQAKKNIFSTGYSWLKSQFSGGSHHEIERVKQDQSIQAIKSEKTTQVIEPLHLDKLVTSIDLTKRASASPEKNFTQAINSDSSVQTISAFEEPTKRRHKKHHRTNLHTTFDIDNAKQMSSVKNEHAHRHSKVKKDHIDDVSKLPLPEAKLTILNIEPLLSPVLELPAEYEKKLETENEQINVLEKQSTLPVFEKTQAEIQFRDDQSKSEVEAEPKLEKEDFNTALRHKAFQKHKRNSQRLSGQWPTYDEQAFIDGTKEVDFIHAANGTGKYWGNPSKPGLVAGQIDHSKMDTSTYQRLGYQAAHGDVEAREKIEAAKKKNAF